MTTAKSDGNTVQLKLLESPNPRYIYIGPNNVVHLMVSMIAGERIGTDNTCKTTAALREFFGKINPNTSAAKYLRDYRAQLEADIHTLHSNGLDYAEVQERLIQVENYITALDRLIQTCSNALDTLNDSFGDLPQSFADIMNSENSNLYTLRLKPASEDGYLIGRNILFSILREDNRTTPFFSNFVNKFPNDIEVSYTTPKLNKINSIVNAFTDNELNARNHYGERIKPIDLVAKITRLIKEKWPTVFNDFSSYRIEDDFITKIKSLWVFDEFEEGMNLNLLEARKSLKWIILAYINQYRDIKDTLPSYFHLLAEESPDNVRYEASIKTQFFLGIANFYLYQNELLNQRTNFGATLDNNNALTNELATQISNATQTNGNIENIIINFISSHRNEFKLKQPINDDHKKAIIDMFNLCFGMIQSSPHFDEFVVRGQRKENAPFFEHQSCICVPFTTLLNHRDFNAIASERSKFTKAANQLPQLQSVLEARDATSISGLSLTEEQMQQLVVGIISNKGQNNDDKLRELRTLFSSVGGKPLFECLGRQFFAQFDGNANTQELFTSLRNTISDNDLLNHFNGIVFNLQKQLLVTENIARSLYVAVEDRRELPRKEVLNYNSKEALERILGYLDLLGKVPADKVAEYQRIDPFFNQLRALDAKQCSVVEGENGLFYIRGPSEMLAGLAEIANRYADSIHLSIDMAASLYKQVNENFSPNHPFVVALNDKKQYDNNKPGDTNPRALFRAMELLGINIPQYHVRYNNTVNDLPYANYLPRTKDVDPRLEPRKGGSGYIIDNISPFNMYLFNNIYNHQKQRLIVPLAVEEAIYAQIHNLGATPILEGYSTRLDRLEAALILLNINYTRVAFNARDNNFVFFLDPKEQSKLKLINSRFAGGDLSGLKLNNEDYENTTGFVAQLITAPNESESLAAMVNRRMTEKRGQAAPALNNSKLSFDEQNLAPYNAGERFADEANRESITLTPDMSHSIYAAVLDRMPPVIYGPDKKTVVRDLTLKYLRPVEMAHLLNDLHGLGFENIEKFTITCGPENSLIINAPSFAIRVIQEICNDNKDIYHIPLAMSSAIFKEVEENKGTLSTEFIGMNALNNNVPDDPKPYRFIRALRLLGIQLPFSDDQANVEEFIRYNNTKNNLPYLSKTNKDDKTMPKKGGHGYMIKGLSNTDIKKLEEITELQANRFLLTEWYETALIGLVEYFENQEVNQLLERCGGNRMKKLDTAILLLGIDVRSIEFKESSRGFAIIASPQAQSQIKKAVNHFATLQLEAMKAMGLNYAAEELEHIHHSIMLFNAEDKNRTESFDIKLAATNNIEEYLNQKRADRQNATPFPLLLPYRHGAQVAVTIAQPADTQQQAPTAPTTTPAFTLGRTSTVTTYVPVRPSAPTTIFTPPQAPEVDLKAPILEAVTNIALSLSKLDNGRQEWFTLGRTTKHKRLERVRDWISANPITAENRLVVLGLIHDICAVKRNKLGLYAPRSLQDFHAAFGAEIKTIPVGAFSSKELESLDKERCDISALINRHLNDGMQNTQG